MLNQILSNYASLLDINMWIHALSNPSSIGLVISLALLECLLSTDNALVLSAFVKPLDEKQQKKALFYGLWGAYIFRFILIGVGTYLIHFWFIKVIGSLYLAIISLQFFYKKYFLKESNDQIDEEKKHGILVKMFGVFWATVISVELMDLVFSVDSILASLAVSNEIWIVMLGGLIGILSMRGIATLIINLMDKVPELETAAFVLIFFISIKMALTLFEYEIPSSIFLSIVTIVFVITFFINYLKKKKKQKEEQI